MSGFVSNGGSGVGKINFVSVSCAEGDFSVRETCSWQDCMFTASKASQSNGCFRLLAVSSRVCVRECME